MHILHTVLFIFPKMFSGRIYLTIKSLYQRSYFWEKLHVGNSNRSKGFKIIILESFKYVIFLFKEKISKETSEYKIF